MVGLCLLGGSRWLLEGASPAAQSTYATQSAGCLGAAGVLTVLGWRSGPRVRVGASASADRRGLHSPLRTIIGGICALAGTGLAATIAPRPIHTDDATLALTMTPCVIAVGSAAFGVTVTAEMTARLWPGLAALAGLLLLLPQPRLSDWRLALALVTMPLLTGIGAVIFGSAAAGPGPGGKTSQKGTDLLLTLLGAAAVHSVLAYVHKAPAGDLHRAFALTSEAVALDGSMALLAALALTRLRAMEWSAQFILVPLVALLEGVIFLRPALDGRSWLAFALLLVSGTYIFVNEGRPRDGSQDLSLV